MSGFLRHSPLATFWIQIMFGYVQLVMTPKYPSSRHTLQAGRPDSTENSRHHRFIIAQAG